MATRILYCGAGLKEEQLSGEGHAVLERIAGGAVVAADSEAALTLLLYYPEATLLAFSRESFEYLVRKLNATDREAAIRRRLAQWSPRAVYEGVQWLYLGQRRCISLTADLPPGTGRARHAEHSMSALHLLVNERRYGSVTLTEMFENLLEREALLQVELLAAEGLAEASMRSRFSLALAQELLRMGRPEYAGHLPRGEAKRAALLDPADAAIRAQLVTRKNAAVDWQNGFVAAFGGGELEAMREQGKQLTILYLDSGAFLQDLSELTPAQIRREFEERRLTGIARMWPDHLNLLRLETALLRRATHAAAQRANSPSAATLAPQIRQETEGMLSELGRYPSWRGGDFAAQPANLADAERELVNDALFLSRFAAQRHEDSLVRRYQAFYQFKVAP